MGQASTLLKQTFCLPQPTLTERNLADQTGKVHIVTGGYSGCGQELAKILYQKNATVYIAGRSVTKATTATNSIKEQFPNSKGRLEFFLVDLSDLSSIKKAVHVFESKETRLDVLTNNAGVMMPPDGSKDHHGHELQMGTNCLGPFLLSELLLPILRRTASSSPPGSVRVTWAGSIAAVMSSPKNGVEFDSQGDPKVHKASRTNYGQSKAGNILLSAEFARRYGKYGIVSVGWSPGGLKTGLQRHLSQIVNMLLSPMLYPPIYGAYTELYSGWSSDLTLEKNGAYIIPWGRIDTEGLRADILKSVRTTEEGGSGVAERFWEWCDKETMAFR